MLKTVSAFAAVLVASTLVVPTVSSAMDSDSVRVSYADLNLTADSGQQLLQHRIVRAAKVVCIYDQTRDIGLARETEACRTDAIGRAQPAYEAAVNNARRGTVTVLDAAALIVTAP
jgi:UrcA family protein